MTLAWHDFSEDGCCGVVHYRRLKDPSVELVDLWRRSAKSYRDAVLRLINAYLNDRDPEPARENLQRILGESLTMADMLGRRRLLLEADHAADQVPADLRQLAVFDSVTVVLPKDQAVPFEDAIADLVGREPRLAATWQDVAELYRERHAFALVRSTDLSVTKKVQELLAKAAEGEPVKDGAEAFADHYGRMVYRTNLNTAYSAGRFQMARDPDVAPVVGAFERYAIGDADVRRGRSKDRGENHWAANGLVAAITDPVWRFAGTPSGYNCRCGLRIVSKFELKRKGLLDANGRVRRHEPATFGSFRPHPAFVPRKDPYG